MRLVDLPAIHNYRCGLRCTTRSTALLAFAPTRALGSRPAPETPSGRRPARRGRAASMQNTLSEGTARAAQLATFSGHRQHSRRHRRPEVWLTESLRRRAARRRARANARRWPSRPPVLGASSAVRPSRATKSAAIIAREVCNQPIRTPANEFPFKRRLAACRPTRRSPIPTRGRPCSHSRFHVPTGNTIGSDSGNTCGALRYRLGARGGNSPGRPGHREAPR